VIISGGIKYFPEMIERKLAESIQERFIITSAPDEKLGEKLVLVIEGTPRHNDQEMKEKLTILQPFERPREIYYLEKFAETSNGKVKRNEIKKAIRRF
jgi:O-succinylbenzoic acid--CoA ligase